MAPSRKPVPTMGNHHAAIISDLALNSASSSTTPSALGERRNPFEDARSDSGSSASASASKRDSAASSQALAPPTMSRSGSFASIAEGPEHGNADAESTGSTSDPNLPAQVLPASPAHSQKAIRFSIGPTPPRSPRTSAGSPELLTPQSQSPVASPVIHQADGVAGFNPMPGPQERMLRYRSYSSNYSTNSLKRASSMKSGLTTSVRKAYPSTKLEGEINKPWMKYPDPAKRWGSIIFWVIVGLGFVGAGALVAFGIMGIPSPGKLCMVMDDDFTNGIDPSHWTHEVRTDGYGNHQFEWTTADKTNSFVEDGTLYLVPTLTSDTIGEDAITNGYTLNLTADGRCTNPNVTNCVAVSNATRGSIINPVQGARIVTKGKASIRYGKVEVEARMPTGDWIWPAIWMLPEDNKYGEWPRSGEIDIVEGRGNNYSYGNMGNDYIQSALHWGPNSLFDTYWKTFSTRQNKVKGYSNDFNKFTLEWTDKYITTYVNNRVYSTLKLDFDQSFWKRGQYPTYWVNGTETLPLTNPWYGSDQNSAPFDQSFYLILNVAVGGTNGFFPDNMGGKPWLDSSLNAMSDFWHAKDKWYPTWSPDPKKRGMAVKSVKMWRQC